MVPISDSSVINKNPTFVKVNYRTKLLYENKFCVPDLHEMHESYMPQY